MRGFARRIGPFRGAALAMSAAAVLIASCDWGSQPLEEADPEAVPRHPTYDMVGPILDRVCAPCHNGYGGKAGDAHCGADDPSGIIRTAINSESMPPGAWPRLTEEEKLLLRRWIQDGACSPCDPCL